jgi:hypothetical protein
MWLLTLQLFKNSVDTQEKLRLNLHSLSVFFHLWQINAFIYDKLTKSVAIQAMLSKIFLGFRPLVSELADPLLGLQNVQR